MTWVQAAAVVVLVIIALVGSFACEASAAFPAAGLMTLAADWEIPTDSASF